ncbi:MAG: MFS transporter [Pseudomonadota bacterium]
MTDAPTTPDAPGLAATAVGAPPNPNLIGTDGAFSRKGIGWVIFEFARNPYYNIIVVYIFAAYFTQVVTGGGPFGFAMTAVVATVSGLVAAPTTPILGTIADQAGRRKPAIALFIGVLASCAMLLWFSKAPGQGGIGMVATMALLVMGYCAYSYSEALHNAMLPSAVHPRAVPVASGLALASANLASVGMFIAYLFLLELPAVAAFGLDKSEYEHVRIVGPFVAVWMVVFILPFFWFLPDSRGMGLTWPQATRNFFRGPGAAPQTIVQRMGVFITYVRSLWTSENNATRFLLARTIYADGMHALLTLGAAYVASFLGWSLIEMTIYAIAGLLFGAIGGILSGILDRLVGSRRALNIEIICVVLLGVFQISITGDSLLFGLVPAGHQVWSGDLIPGLGFEVFTRLSDVVYFLTVIPGAICVVAVIASSRSMLVHVAPPARIGEFFGLYAIAGTATVWMGPALVSVLTLFFGSQRIGMAGISILFFAGLAMLQTVKDNPHLMDAPAREG